MAIDTLDERTVSGEHDGRHVNISIDGRHFRVEERAVTGAALKVLGGVPTDYQLFLEVPGPGPDRGIRDDEVVELRNGQRFYGVVSGTLGCD